MKEELIENGKKVAKRLCEVICEPTTNTLALPELAAAYDATARRLMILGKLHSKAEEETVN